MVCKGKNREMELKYTISYSMLNGQLANSHSIMFQGNNITEYKNTKFLFLFFYGTLQPTESANQTGKDCI